jgi:uncharacterized protein (DUF433 family)
MESVQRSFRLSAATCTLLDSLAATSNESRNSLVERLLAEALRTESHPLIGFRQGAAGRREPLIIGTRLLVRQVVPLAREDGVVHTAQELGITPRQVQAAIAYYADFAEEIDSDSEWAMRVEDEEHARWERERALTA